MALNTLLVNTLKAAVTETAKDVVTTGGQLKSLATDVLTNPAGVAKETIRRGVRGEIEAPRQAPLPQPQNGLGKAGEVFMRGAVRPNTVFTPSGGDVRFPRNRGRFLR